MKHIPRRFPCLSISAGFHTDRNAQITKTAPGKSSLRACHIDDGSVRCGILKQQETDRT